jgi:hypothetical protein
VLDQQGCRATAIRRSIHAGIEFDHGAIEA